MSIIICHQHLFQVLYRLHVEKEAITLLPSLVDGEGRCEVQHDWLHLRLTMPPHPAVLINGPNLISTENKR